MSSQMYENIMDSNYAAVISQLQQIYYDGIQGYCILYGNSKIVSPGTPACEVIHDVLGKTNIRSCGKCPYFIPGDIIKLAHDNPDDSTLIAFIDNLRERLKRL